MTDRVHTVTTGPHWAIRTEKVSCPKCGASTTRACIRSERDPKRQINFERFPDNTVHVERVQATGHQVLGTPQKMRVLTAEQLAPLLRAV